MSADCFTFPDFVAGEAWLVEIWLDPGAEEREELTGRVADEDRRFVHVAGAQARVFVLDLRTVPLGVHQATAKPRIDHLRVAQRLEGMRRAKALTPAGSLGRPASRTPSIVMSNEAIADSRARC